MYRPTPKIFVYFILLIIFFWPHQTVALENNAKENQNQVLTHLIPAFDHLLALTDASNPTPFDASQITDLIDFVISAKPQDQHYTLGSRNGGTSAYYEFSVNRTLKQVLELVYNPRIPSHVVTPSSVRLSNWIEINGKKNQPLPDFSEALKDLSTPYIVKGAEFIENTPDTTSGAYYAYELDRTLILMKYQGQPVLLSLSNQRDKSSVGKKGLVLGSDENWSYLYTGEKGITKKGLGWADSYMYNSSSIVVYYQTKGAGPEVKFGSFKWLKAGWAGINLAQPYHLRDGIKRLALSFKEILESPALGDIPKVARMFNQIENLSMDELRRKSRIYFDQLAQRYGDDNKLNRKWFSALFKDDSYIDNMRREEMQALVSVEYIKYLLCKGHPFDIGYFQSTKVVDKRPG